MIVAALSIGLWQLAEYAWPPRDRPALLRAALTMSAASAVIRAEKTARSLLQSPELDPNQTGLIGPELTETTTTVGNLEAKRTLTNPDVAALFALLFARRDLREGDRVAVVLSGSFVGANVAALSAIEACGLDARIVTSLGASMYGAADPDFTWLDMERAVRDAGIWRARSGAAILGGESGNARDLGEDARRVLRSAAERHAVRLLQAASFSDLVRDTAATLGFGPDETQRPKMLINIGGAQVALGDCREAGDIPPGLIERPLPCTEGRPGLIQIALAAGIPVLNVLKIKPFARQYGLPLDPIPLPKPGANRFIFAR